MESKAQYFSRRAAEERLAAERAQSQRAVECHRVLAEKYAAVAIESLEAEAASS